MRQQGGRAQGRAFGFGRIGLRSGEAGSQLALLQDKRGGGQFGQNLVCRDRIAHIGRQGFDRLPFDQGHNRDLLHRRNQSRGQNVIFHNAGHNFGHRDGG